MFKALSDFFLSIGVHPVLGGFFLGILCCITLVVIKRFLGIEARKATNDELARFRDPNSFSVGTTVTAKMSFQSGGERKELPDHISAQVIESLRAGNKIEAIKIFKDATGLGLKECKDIVEALQRRMGL